MTAVLLMLSTLALTGVGWDLTRQILIATGDLPQPHVETPPAPRTANRLPITEVLHLICAYIAAQASRRRWPWNR